MHRFAVLGRFLVTRSSGPRALVVALPLYLAIGILATVIFAHSGLDASTVVRRAEHSAAARFILLSAWCAATLPAVRAIVSTETNLVLRSLPVVRWQLLAWLGALIFVAELPWFVLFARGGGPMSGLGATMIALALHACALARVRDATDVLLIAVTCAAWLGPRAFIDGDPLVTSMMRLALGAVAFAIALARAWQRAPELPALRATRRIGGSPWQALAMGHALVLFRAHRAALARAAFVVAIVMGWTTLALLNDESLRSGRHGVLRLAMSGWIPSSIVAAGTVLGPIFRTDATAEWVLSVCGTTNAERRGATIGLVAVAGIAVGALAGGSVVVALNTVWELGAILPPSLAIAGGLLSAATAVVARWTLREEGLDAGRLVVALGLLIALAEGLLWMSPLG